MKKTSVMLIAALALAPQAQAADFTTTEAQQAGAFGGFRIRLALGGPRAERMRAGLTIAPTLRSRGFHGESRMLIGEGLELGMADREPLRLSIAGTPVSRLVQGRAAPGGRRLGVSTIGWVAIGVGVVAVSFLALVQLCADGEVCGSE